MVIERFVERFETGKSSLVRTRDFPQAWLANVKTGIARQYIRTITARDRLLKRSNAPSTAMSSNVSTDSHPYKDETATTNIALLPPSRQSAFFGQSSLSRKSQFFW
jgi:hypothetical protein